MRNKVALLAAFLVLSLPSMAMQRLQGWCEKGSVPVVAPASTGGSPTLRYFQQSYPSCSVAVRVAGTSGFASIYSDNMGTVLANPFTATSTGYWGFYVNNGTYDIQISGGGLSAPITFGAVMAFDIAGYTPPSVSFSQITPGANGGTLQMATGGLFETQAGAAIDFGLGSHTRPWLTGLAADKPGTCTAGEAYFATDATAGQNIYICTSANTWTQVQPGGSGGPFLPLSGGTMTGSIISNNSGIGSVTITYPSSLKATVSGTSGQSSTCTAGGPANCPDTTLIDYFGFEGVFHRIKGGGDYFDWTRWGNSTSALPVHTINFNDSSFNTLIHVDETGGYPSTRTQFNGGIDLGYCNDPGTPGACSGISPDIGIYRNTTNTLEVTIGGPSGGMAANLATTLGKSFQAFATGTDVGLQVNNGTMKVLGNGLTYSNNYEVSTTGTIGWNISSMDQPAFRYNAGHVQFSDDGSSWTDIASSATPNWTLTMTNLYPSSTGYSVFVGATADDGSAAKFQVTGAIHGTSTITAGTTVTGTTGVLIGGTNPLTMDSRQSLRNNGTNVQFSDDNGSSWTNIASLAAGHWTLTGSNLRPDMTSYQVFIAKGNSDDMSGAPLQVAGVTGLGGCGGNYCSINTGGGIQANPPSGVAFQVNSGVFGVDYTGIVTTGQYYNSPQNAAVDLVGTLAWEGVGRIRYNHTSQLVEIRNTNSPGAWTAISTSAGAWTLSGNNLYPTNSANKVFVGTSMDDTSGAVFQTHGDIRATGNIDATLKLVSEATGMNIAFQGGGGTFQVLGNGLTGAANFNLGAGGTYQFNGQAGFRCTGGGTCNLQWSPDGSNWNDFTSSNTWTLNTSGAHTLRPSDAAALVLIGRSTFDTSSAWLEVGADSATSPRAANFHGELAVQAVSTNFAINVNSGFFAVNGLGAVSAAGPLNIQGGGSLLGANGSSGTTLRVNGQLIAGTWETGFASLPSFTTTGTSNAIGWTARTVSSYTGASGQLWEFYATDTTRTALWSTAAGDVAQWSSAAGATPYGTMNLTQGWLLFGSASPGTVGAGFRKSGGVMQWSNDGTNWNNFSTGSSGVTSVTGINPGISISPTTGAVVVQNTGVTSVQGSASQIAVSGSTGSVTISLPSSLNIGGQYASGASGASVAFTGSSFQILGNGNFNTNGDFNGGNIILASAKTISQSGVGTLSDATGTWVQNVHIPVSGSIYVRAFATSTAASCSGVADGWFGVTGDGYLVACYSSTRYRVALTAY